MEKGRKPRLDLMIDIETLGTNPRTAPIISISIVDFNPTIEEELHEPMERFSANLDINASIQFHHRKIDTKTLLWWHEQSLDSFKAALKNPQLPKTAMRELLETLDEIAEKNDIYFWCKGIDFDIPMIESYLESCELHSLPYFFSHKYDVRTLLKIAEMNGWEDTFKDKVTHTAFDDCMLQIDQVRSAIKFLKK